MEAASSSETYVLIYMVPYPRRNSKQRESYLSPSFPHVHTITARTYLAKF